jgi:hypothetical protein
MHYILWVHVPDSRECLAKKFVSLGLADASVLVLVAKQCPAFCDFHDHVHFIILDKSIPKFDDMRMVDIWMKVNLPL